MCAFLKTAAQYKLSINGWGRIDVNPFNSILQYFILGTELDDKDHCPEHRSKHNHHKKI